MAAAQHPPAPRPRVRARRGQATDPHSIAERVIFLSTDLAELIFPQGRIFKVADEIEVQDKKKLSVGVPFEIE